jgi:hypothetical protein
MGVAYCHDLMLVADEMADVVENRPPHGGVETLDPPSLEQTLGRAARTRSQSAR